MQNLYLNIVQTINDNKKRFKELELEPIRTVDIYNGQPENPEAFEFVTPALFIDYSIDWERGSSNYKMGVLNIDVHIITDPRPGTENWSGHKDEGLRRLAYYSLIMELLGEVSSETTGRLNAVAERPAQTDCFDYHIITFDTSITRIKEVTLIYPKNLQPTFNV